MAFLLITGLTTVVLALAVAFHTSRLRGARAARLRANRAEARLDQLYRQALDHADVDLFARVVVDEITNHRKATE